MQLDLWKVPTLPGVYIWKNKNKVLYVGKAKNLKNRLSQYFRTWIGAWKHEMVSKATNVDWIVTDNEEEALLLENQLIKKYQPPYNSLLKGDTGYTYIRIWEWDFPKIEFTRYKDKPWIYIWPKPWKKDLKDILRVLRQILKFRTCSDTKFKKWKVCSDYILWLCKGWCDVGFQDDKKDNQKDVSRWCLDDWRCKIRNSSDISWEKVEYQNGNLSDLTWLSFEEYKKIVELIVKYFQGEDEPLKQLIKQKIQQAIQDENYEYAALLRDIYFKLDKFINKQIIELPQKISWYFVKIRYYEGWYFMVYIHLKDGKLIDIVKLKDTENNFLQTMKQDWLISHCEQIADNFYFCK